MSDASVKTIKTRAEWRALLRERFGIAPEESPVSWPVDTIRKAVARQFPAFRRARIRVLRRSHSLVAEFDRDWIFKFVWHPRANFKREISILKLLEGRLGVEVPVPVFVGQGARFFGYRRIPGQPPSAREVSRMGPARMKKFASAICDLVQGVQAAIPRARRRRLLGSRPAITKREVIQAEARQFAAIFGKSPALAAASRRIFGNYIKRCSGLSKGKLRFVGFDLQFDNLLVNRDFQLVGVVDLGYLTWSDAPGMFGLLYMDHPVLARMAIREFGRRLKMRVSPVQARAQGMYAVFSYLIELSTNRWDLAGRRKKWLRYAKASQKMGSSLGL